MKNRLKPQFTYNLLVVQQTLSNWNRTIENIKFKATKYKNDLFFLYKCGVYINIDAIVLLLRNSSKSSYAKHLR